MKQANFLYPTTSKGYKNVYNLNYRGIDYKVSFYEERGEETVPNWFVRVLEVNGEWEGVGKLELCRGMDLEFDRISAYPSMKAMILAIERFAENNTLEFILDNN